MTLVYLVCGWLAGIVLARAGSLPWWAWGLFALAALAAILLLRQRAMSRLIAACVLLMALGGLRFSLSVPHFNEGDLAAYNDEGFVTVEGWIADAPDARDTHINLRVHAESLSTDDADLRPVGGLALVQAPRVAEYRYGDPVRVRGELVTPPELDTFSYRDYLAREGVYSLMRYAQVEVIGPRRGSPIRAALLDFREAAHRTIARLLPDPQAALLSGILLGIESDISPDVRDAFNTVSATHVIVISGSNLVIIAGLVQGLARRAVKHHTWVALITIAAVIFYTVFVGGDPAVTRAAVMVTLGLVALELGRQTYGLASLSFAAFLMTAITPGALWDAGFQLSFLATLGLILYVEPLQSLLAKGLARLFSEKAVKSILAVVSDAFIVTIAAQITTTPIMAYTFGRFSLLALPTSFLIVPAQTPLMVFGGLAVLAALLVWPLGQLLAWGSWLFLTWTVGVVRFFAALPYASLQVSNLPAWAVVAIYAAIFGATAFAMQPPPERKRLLGWATAALPTKLVVMGGLISAALLASAATALPDGRLHVTFFELDSGNATLIETPSGRQILIDAGGGGRRLSAALGGTLPFWDRSIDLLVITQPGSAHTNGLPALMRRYRFDAVLTNGVRGNNQVMQPVWAELDESGTPQVVARQGMRIRVDDGVTLTVLRAQIDPPASTDDPGEPVSVMIAYDTLRVLIPGDLTAEGEAALLNSDVFLDATVLVVPRSGHRQATSEALLAAASPQIAVIAIPTDNDSLPHQETLDRLGAAQIVLYRTDQVGSVEIVSDGTQMWVRTER